MNFFNIIFLIFCCLNLQSKEIYLGVGLSSNSNKNTFHNLEKEEFKSDQPSLHFKLKHPKFDHLLHYFKDEIQTEHLYSLNKYQFKKFTPQAYLSFQQTKYPYLNETHQLSESTDKDLLLGLFIKRELNLDNKKINLSIGAAQSIAHSTSKEIKNSSKNKTNLIFKMNHQFNHYSINIDYLTTGAKSLKSNQFKLFILRRF